jgi:hypothetical protein
MPDSSSTSEKEEATKAVTLGLTDQTAARTLQDAGDSSKRKRDQNRAEREQREQSEREQRERDAASKKCMLFLIV